MAVTGMTKVEAAVMKAGTEAGDLELKLGGGFFGHGPAS